MGAFSGKCRVPRTKRVTFAPRLKRAYWLPLFLFLIPRPAFSQSAGEWAQIRANCGLPSSTVYNDWVAQGCPCNKSSAGSSTPAPSLPTLNPQQQLGMQIGTLGANMIGQGLHQWLAGKPVTPPDPAQQQRQLAAQQLNNSGIWFLKQKKYPQAINEFEQALQKTPNDQTIKNNLAYARRLLEQSRKDGIAVAKTSNSLANLLGTNTPGSLPIAEGSPASALNSINLNSDANIVDLRGTTQTAVDPAMLKNAPQISRDGQPITQQDLDAQFDQAMNASEAESQADRTRLNQEFDKAMNMSEAESQSDNHQLNIRFDKAYNDAALHPEPASPRASPAFNPPPITQSQPPAPAPAASSSVHVIAPTPAAQQPIPREPFAAPAAKAANPNQALSQSLNEALPPAGVDFHGRGPDNSPVDTLTVHALASSSPGTAQTLRQSIPAPAVQSAAPAAVDTRNVPSGLPKSLEDAIAAAYPAAVPGVSDRVRKGFQAVQNRDWVTAQVCFQDALNHDPGNASLQQFVDLASEAATGNFSPAAQDSIWQQFVQLVSSPPRKAPRPGSVAAVRD